MQIVWLVNWNSNNADFQFQTAPSSLINQWVISGLAVTTNQVWVGSALISVTSGGQSWLITYHNTSVVTIDTSGTKKVWIDVTQAKIDNGVANNEDGTGIAQVNTWASYPVSGSYIPLASITSWVITDDRVFISMKGVKRKWMTANRLIYIDASWNEQELPYGTAGQVLTVVNATTTPIWSSPSVDIHWATQKNTPVGSDEALVADSAASFVIKKITLNSFLSPFWDGSDWDVTISTNTTLVRDMYYRNLTINSTIVLNPNGYKIFVSETLTNNGIIRRNGNDWTAWTSIWWVSWSIPAWVILNQWSLNAEVAWWTSGVSNGAYGTHLWVAWTSSSPSYTNINGVAWWTSTGFYWTTSAWWAGGTSTRWALYNVAYNSVQAICALINPASFNLSATQYKWPSGSGGGGTDSAANNAGWYGGWAWWNGWAIFICAKTINNTSGVIESKWWNGGNGWWGSIEWGGGGGGWQGGVVILIYVTLTSIGTVTLTWGTWWAKWGTGAATAGANWNTWVTIQIPITI